MDLGWWVRRISCNGFGAGQEGVRRVSCERFGGGSGGCHVMDLGCVRRVSCDGLGMVGQGDVM